MKEWHQHLAGRVSRAVSKLQQLQGEGQAA